MDLITIANDIILKSQSSECLDVLLNSDFEKQKHNYFAVAYYNNNFDLCRALLDSGVDILKKDDFSNRLPLAYIIKDIDLYNYAINKIDNINKFDEKNDFNLLLSACFEGNEEKVNLLIENGANINVSNYQNLTPFYDACRSGNINIVKVLIKNNVKNLYEKTISLKSPITVALERGHFGIVEYLLEEGYDLSKISDLYEFLFFVAILNNYNIASLVGDYYLDLTRISYYETPLLEAFSLKNKIEMKSTFMQETVVLYNRCLLDDRTFQLIAKYNIENEYEYRVSHPKKKLLYETTKTKQDNEEEFVDVVVVKYFENVYKTYTFLSNGIQCKPGDRVLVNTSGMEQSVIVVNGNRKENKKKYAFALKCIIRKL